MSVVRSYRWGCGLPLLGALQSLLLQRCRPLRRRDSICHAGVGLRQSVLGCSGGVGEGGTAASAQRELVLAGSVQKLCVISVFAGVVACSASSCFISVIAVAKMSSSKVAGFLFVRAVGVVVVDVSLFAMLAFVVGVIYVGDSWFATRV